MESDPVTVFRSADPSAQQQAEAVQNILDSAGLGPELCGADTPGIPAGVWEVRVPADEVRRAEALIASHEQEISQPGDASPSFDLVTLFSSDRHNAEMEAIGIRALLDAADIPSVIVGASVYPNLPFEVRVPRNCLEDAQRVIAESQAAGPEAAEEAEKASESRASEGAE
jgi:hypothetical protein